MAKNTDYTTQVENYLNGGMSNLEKSSFENELINNSELKTELKHQSELIEGIKSFRRIELKSRLAAINLNPTILGVISQSAALKSAILAGSTALIATGAYLYLDSNKLNFDLQKVEAISEYILEESELPEVTSNLEAVVIEELKIESNNKKVERPKVLPPTNKEPKIQSPDFSVPNSPNTSEESGLISSSENQLQNSSNDLETLSSVGNMNKVVVQNKVDKKYKFHYQYSEGKLYLFGKFELSPYEIIEINRKAEKRIYFYYNDRYYNVEQNTSEVKPFEMISDINLIKELKILKSK